MTNEAQRPIDDDPGSSPSLGQPEQGYEAPRLAVIGSVQELTLGAGGITTDLGEGMSTLP
jgi:hypothetical protein